MNLDQRIEAFTKLGKFLCQFSTPDFKKADGIVYNDMFFDGFIHQMKIANEHNGWFTKENVIYAINSWTELLTKPNLKKWVKKYDLDNVEPKRIAIVMAGNIPLVGFHDFLSVLISGHKVIIKQSSNDKHLLPFIAKYLEYIEPRFIERIDFTEEKLEDFDGVIATGSDNTARYFEYYFKGKPSIIRKNRNSAAVITGEETEDDYKALSEDIFRYYGLGCRNVSKLFVPRDYDFDTFFKGMYHWSSIMNQEKYVNNYDYNKAVYLMSEFDLLENGFLMIKEDESYASPIATIFYEYYDDPKKLKRKIKADTEKIQCIVSKGFMRKEVPFGQTQKPQLHNYADNVDTIEFLTNI